MLERFEVIRKVGLFEDYSHTPGCDFGEVTLIYGENGVGKSTLAAILDSLRERNAEEIIRRRSLPGDVAPTVSIALGGSVYSFDGRDWDNNLPYDTIDVFFPGFVIRNVHTSTGVDTDHRRHLCELMLGRRAIEKVTRLAVADKEARVALDEIKGADKDLKLLIKPPDTLDTFRGLTSDPEVEEHLAELRTELKQAQSKDAFLARAMPKTVELPTIDRSAIAKLLEKSTEGIGADASAIVRQHIEQHLDKNAETWLANGVRFIGTDNKCPFCAQDITGLKLTEAIRAYFTEEYRTYNESLSVEIEAIRSKLDSAVFATLRAAFSAQFALAAQWADIVPMDLSATTAGINDAEVVWKSAVIKLESVILRKYGKPLEKMEPSLADEALAEYKSALDVLGDANKTLLAFAKKAEDRKAALSRANPVMIEQRLNHLENQKNRFEPLAEALLKKKGDNLEKRKELETEKVGLKEEIDKLAATVVGRYQAGINFYLDYFGCDIRIESVEPSFPSGRASVQYKLKAHGHEIELGISTVEPCFETVLSEGDKNTLALSFFFARLKDHANLNGRTIVLDDPVNSLGFSRRSLIEGVIRDLRMRGAQVVVMTHDERLAAMMWRDKRLRGTVSLQVDRTRSGSQLKPWDVERATQSEYVKDYLALQDYLENGGDHKNAARSIRPYVEQRLRHLYPGPPFQTRHTLGDMIAKIRESPEGSRLCSLKTQLPGLVAINDASLPGHHASDDVLGMPQLTPEVVRIFAQKALDVLG
jgi:wobble nucleotide-excising tRNase